MKKQNMNGSFIIACGVWAISLAGAQEQAPQALDAVPAATPAVAEQKAPAKAFDPLVRVILAQGLCEVNNPDVGAFKPVENNKTYPMGSVFKTAPDASLTVAFSDSESVQLMEKTEVRVNRAAEDAQARCVLLIAGRIKTFLSDNLLEGRFSVSTPNALCKNMAGRAEFELASRAEGEDFQVATITGTMRVEGSQYAVAALRAANTLNVVTAPNRSLSRLTSISGDYAVTLENGTETPITFGMSPKAVVKIWREVAPVGGRMIVSTLVVSPVGTARHRFTYVMGRSNLVTGDEVSQAAPVESEAALPVLLKTEEKPAAAAPKEEPVAAPQQ